MKRIIDYSIATGTFLKKACKRYASLYKGKKWYVKTLLALATFFLALIIYLGAVDINFLWLFGKSPGFSDI